MFHHSKSLYMTYRRCPNTLTTSVTRIWGITKSHFSPLKPFLSFSPQAIWKLYWLWNSFIIIQANYSDQKEGPTVAGLASCIFTHLVKLSKSNSVLQYFNPWFFDAMLFIMYVWTKAPTMGSLIDKFESLILIGKFRVLEIFSQINHPHNE